jgi:hypothetical protein
MAKFAKKEKESKGNVLADPEVRKKFKSALATITHYFQQADDAKEGAKESVADIAVEYGVDKKLVRKLATVMYKHNYGDLQEENHHFEILYETVIEGKLRDADQIGGDPLDAPVDDEAGDE